MLGVDAGLLHLQNVIDDDCSGSGTVIPMSCDRARISTRLVKIAIDGSTAECVGCGCEKHGLDLLGHLPGCPLCTGGVQGIAELPGCGEHPCVDLIINMDYGQGQVMCRIDRAISGASGYAVHGQSSFHGIRYIMILKDRGLHAIAKTEYQIVVNQVLHAI